MKKASAFTLAVVLTFVLSPGQSAAQQKSLREQLIGAWELVLCERTTPKGATQPYCVNSIGTLILDASGRYAQMIAARGRPKLSTVNRLDVPAEQYKAAVQGFLANFGTWSVNEKEKTVTCHYEGAMLPNYEGTDSKMSISIAGDELTLVDPNPNAGLGQGRFVTVYRQVSSQH
jgi:lipocalin-like protein